MALPALVSAQEAMVFLPRDRPQVSDSVFPHRDCESIEEPIGLVVGQGTVGYWLGRDGRADTSTVRVLDSQRISVAGYRSVVTRFLAGCRVSLPRAFPREGRAVVQEIGLLGAAILPLAARPVDSLPDGLEPGPVLIPTTGLPLASDDPRLDERPNLVFGCMPRRPPAPPGGAYASLEDAQRDFDRWAAANSGRIRIEVEVGTDGKAVRNTARILESDNPSATNSLLSSIMRCQFAPGRIGGRPVSAVAVVTQGQSMVRSGPP